MKKGAMIGAVLIAFVLVFSISAVSAKTLIAGKIYNSDFSQTVAGANVTVTCNGNAQVLISASDGAYSAIYDESDQGQGSCDSGDSLTVYASHPNYGVGSETGIIHDNMVLDLDVGIVNVPLVPEFGLIIGGLTIISAVVVFFFVRRQ